jgi:hypothetical protein
MAGEIKFELQPVDEKPTRTYAKGSKYDPIIDSFLEGKNKLVEVTTEKEPNYLRTQLGKRITARELTGIAVSVANNKAYLEKVDE